MTLRSVHNLSDILIYNSWLFHFFFFLIVEYLKPSIIFFLKLSFHFIPSHITNLNKCRLIYCLFSSWFSPTFYNKIFGFLMLFFNNLLSLIGNLNDKKGFYIIFPLSIVYDNQTFIFPIPQYHKSIYNKIKL